MTSVPVNGLIRERVKQLWENEPYKSIDVQTDLSLDDMKTVRASSEWLRRALDILIDNAVTAMAGCPRRKITIQTDQENDKAMIFVSDTGKGIPADNRPHLFIEKIEKPEGSKGLGIGTPHGPGHRSNLWRGYRSTTTRISRRDILYQTAD